MGAGYRPGIEASPGCGRFKMPGLGIIPVGSCVARGDGVSARRQEIGLPAGLRSPLPRLFSSASRASILKFLDFSIAARVGQKRTKKPPENKPTWSFAAAHLFRASQRRWRSQTRACSLLRRFRKVDSTGVPLGPSKTLQIIHVSHFSARPGEQKATEQQRCARRPSPPLRGCCAGIGCCPSCTGGPLIS